MKQWSRRKFIQNTGAGIAAASPFILANARGADAPSNLIRHAVIGTGGMGSNHVKEFDSAEGCSVVAVCDVDPERLAKAAAIPRAESKVKPFDDFRRILDDPTIQSISIATPDHWHAPIALAAMLAGKHVYVEKPCCHNIREGALLVETAKKHKRCLQHGTQTRSGAGVREAMQFLHEGKLGKVRLAKAINHQMREAIGREPDGEPPAGVNYDMWLGPAPKRPFSKNRWHYNWHWHWDYGTGDLGNDGIHQVDVARWGLNVDLPKAISASGGQLFYDDDHETPDTQVVTYEYDDCYLLYEMRLWTPYTLEGHENGVVFYSQDGKLEVGRGGCFVTMNGEETKQIGGGADLKAHIKNYLDAIRNDAPETLNAGAEAAFMSAAMCHMGNIATRVGRRLHYDAAKHQFTGDDEANKLVTRDYRSGYELPV